MGTDCEDPNRLQSAKMGEEVGYGAQTNRHYAHSPRPDRLE